MNCRDIESLLLAEKDGVLTAAQHAELGQHVGNCPACRQLRKNLAEATSDLRAEVAGVVVPDIDTEWTNIRSRLGSVGKTERKRPLAPVIWLGAPVAAAAALALAFFVGRPGSSEATPASATTDLASAEFVEAGNTDASTMVYVDKESGWLVVWATDGETDHNI